MSRKSSRPQAVVLIFALCAIGVRAHSWAAGPLVSTPPPAQRPEARAARPLVIAHRGASAYLPEHTLAAYAAAIAMGADVVEPDVVLTRDGVLICSHDLTLESTTDVAERFPARGRADGTFHALDFDLAEIRTLDQRGRAPGPRQPGHRVATLEEVIALVRDTAARLGRDVGIIPEPKSPARHREQGAPIEDALVLALHDAGYAGPGDGCTVQCFELEALERMAAMTRLPLVFLVGETPDRATLDRASRVSAGVGPRRTLLFDEAGEPTEFVLTCLELGLPLYPWTLGSNERETAQVLCVPGVAGVFTNNPDVALRVRDAVFTPGSDLPRTGSSGP